MSAHSRLSIAALTLLGSGVLAVAACTDGSASGDGTTGVPGAVIEPRAAGFADLYTLVDTIVLEQPDSAPIVRLSGIDIDGAGRIAIGDASEGNAKIFDSAGRLMAIVGRKGQGPGEFQEPRYPRFHTDGRLFVADGAIGRVSLFDARGTFTGSVQLEKLAALSGFEVLPDGRFLSTSQDGDGYVLFETDSTGHLLRRFLKLRDVRPRSRPDNPYWANVRQFWLTARNDTAYVVCTLSDSLWVVSLRDGAVTARALVVPGYEIPEPPKQDLRSIPELMKWSRSLQIAGKITAGRSGIVIDYVRGVLNFGHPNIAVVRQDGGVWHAAAAAPAILHSGDNYLTSLHSASDSVTDRVVLGRYRLRGE